MLLLLDGLDTINSVSILANKWDYGGSSDAPTWASTGRGTGGTRYCLQGNETMPVRWKINALSKTIPRAGVASPLFVSASVYPLAIDVAYNSLFNPCITLLSKNICSDWSASLTGRSGLMLTFQNDTQTFQLENLVNGVRTILATSAAAVVPLNDWRRVEMRVDIPGDSIDVRVNGVSVLTSSADLADHAVGIAQVGYSQFIGRVDDPIIYTGQNTGDGFNDWLGDIIIDTLSPSAAGTTTEWTRASGSSANYAYVDEVPLQSTTTSDYLYASTVGLKDTYGYGNMSVTPTTIHAAVVTSHMEAAGGTTRPQVCAVARLSSTEVDSPASYVPLTRFTPLQASYPAKPGGGAWTKTDIDAAEFGIKVTAN